jgi:hypothetical protein
LRLEWAISSSSVPVAYAFSAQHRARPARACRRGGSSANIRLDANPALAVAPARITIGNFLGIETGASCVVAVITNVDGTDKAVGAQARGLLARADFLGEIRTHDNGGPAIRPLLETGANATRG